MHKIFIDGHAGTTGLELRARLQGRDDLELLLLEDEERKDSARRAAALAESDVAILCLPDDAAREAVSLASGQTRLLDASTAHRVAADWTYGLPELCTDQRKRLAEAQFVSNPGCYPQGFILLVRPLIEAGLIDAHTPLSCHAVSGFSGGGRNMIEAYQGLEGDADQAYGARAYGLTLQHKHVPEMQAYSNSQQRPLFAPTVANYYKGMLVHIPLHRSQFKGSTQQLQETLTARYADETFIKVLPLAAQEALEDGFLSPTQNNDSNRMDLMVFGNEEQVLLCARYDNLGKGAAGAAVQNLNLMLGLDETLGLQA